MMLPIPLRTSASAVHDPTPPRPIMATVAEESRFRMMFLGGVDSVDESSAVSLLAYSLQFSVEDERCSKNK